MARLLAELRSVFVWALAQFFLKEFANGFVEPVLQLRPVQQKQGVGLLGAENLAVLGAGELPYLPQAIHGIGRSDALELDFFRGLAGREASRVPHGCP